MVTRLEMHPGLRWELLALLAGLGFFLLRGKVKRDRFSRYEIRSSKGKGEFRLVVFTMDLPEEGEEGHWQKYPLAEML